MFVSTEYDFDCSESEAITEIAKHGRKAYPSTRVFENGDCQRWLFADCPETSKPEPIAVADGETGEYYANDIMAWLGY